MRNDHKPSTTRIAQETMMANRIAATAAYCPECGGTLRSWRDNTPERKPIRLCTACGHTQAAPDLEAMVAGAALTGGLI